MPVGPWECRTLFLELFWRGYKQSNLQGLKERLSQKFMKMCVLKRAITPQTLDDQRQSPVDSKPAGQPEQASFNQCQLIAANCSKLMLCACPADDGGQVSL